MAQWTPVYASRFDLDEAFTKVAADRKIRADRQAFEERVQFYNAQDSEERVESTSRARMIANRVIREERAAATIQRFLRGWLARRVREDRQLLGRIALFAPASSYPRPCRKPSASVWRWPSSSTSASCGTWPGSSSSGCCGCDSWSWRPRLKSESRLPRGVSPGVRPS